MIRTLALMLALYSGASGQSVAEPQPVLTGRTVGADGQLLRKVDLILLPIANNLSGDPTPFIVTSDKAGRFEFYGVPPGRYRLRAECAGYLNTYYAARSTSAAGSVLTLSAGEPVTDLRIRMIEQSMISGKITMDEDTVSMVIVYLFQQRYQDGGRQWVRVGSVMANPSGEFSINKLAPGRYRLAAEARGVEAPASPGQRPERYSLTYFPGVADAGAAETIELGPGQTVADLSLPLRKSPLFAVSGIISRKPSDSPRVIAFLAAPGLGTSSNTTVTGDRFRMESIPAGSYTLGVLEQSAGGTRLLAVQPVRVSSDLDGVSLDLNPDSLRGTVRFAGEAPAGAKLRVLLSPVDDVTPYSAQADVNADGAFAIPGSFTGRFRLHVQGLPPDAYLKSAVYGEKDALGVLNLAPTLGDEKLAIVIGAAAARISGVARDEKGKALDAVVTLIPDPPQPQRASLYQLAETGENGRFQFQGLPPGKYRLYAWEEFEAGAQFDPEVTAPFAARSVAVEVAEGERKEVAVARIAVDDVEAALKPR
jgi:hypothetical protein